MVLERLDIGSHDSEPPLVSDLTQSSIKMNHVLQCEMYTIQLKEMTIGENLHDPGLSKMCG